MDKIKENYLHSDLSKEIINAFFKVYNRLGYGFLEKVYENALLIELQKRGFEVKQQLHMEVLYDDLIVGQFYSDLIVNDLIILEIKASKDIAQEHEAQLINYLKASEIEVGLLLNFGSTPKILRRVFTNDKKVLTKIKEDEYDVFIVNRENL